MGQFSYVEEILVIGTFHQQMVQAKKKKPLHWIHHSCCVTGSLSRPHTRQQCGYRHTLKNSFDKEEIMHWLNRMLNYAAETKQALTGMTSEAPTKHILNVKAIPTSHWEFLLENRYLQTVMHQGYRQQGRRLRQRREIKRNKSHSEGESWALKRRWWGLS